MKKTILATILAMSCVAHAQTIPEKAFSATQIALEGAFDAVLVADYQQTSKIDGFCDGRVNCSIHETNPLLGDDPGRARVHNYFLTTAATHAAVSYFIDPKYRTAWQAVSLGLETAVVIHNKHIGLNFNF